jgi:hypothetical protein
MAPIEGILFLGGDKLKNKRRCLAVLGRLRSSWKCRAQEFRNQSLSKTHFLSIRTETLSISGAQQADFLAGGTALETLLSWTCTVASPVVRKVSHAIPGRSTVHAFLTSHNNKL